MHPWRIQLVLLWSLEVCWYPRRTVYLHGNKWNTEKQHLFLNRMMGLLFMPVHGPCWERFLLHCKPVWSVDYVNSDNRKALAKQMHSGSYWAAANIQLRTNHSKTLIRGRGRLFFMVWWYTVAQRQRFLMLEELQPVRSELVDWSQAALKCRSSR